MVSDKISAKTTNDGYTYTFYSYQHGKLVKFTLSEGIIPAIMAMKTGVTDIHIRSQWIRCGNKPIDSVVSYH